MPLAMQYKANILFQKHLLKGMWATDTMDVRVNSVYGHQYEQVFSNGTYFAEIYPMAKKADTWQALNMFVMEPGVPE